MRILVVDDHAIFRIGLRQVLAELRAGVELVETASVDAALARLAADPGIDVVLVDLLAPGMGEGAGLERLSRARKDLAIVVAAAETARARACGVVERGALGLVSKAAGGREILEALDSVRAGRSWLPEEAGAKGPTPALFGPAARALSEAEGHRRLGRLTKRQREVLARLLEGRSNAEIARELGLAEGTVRIHVSSILKGLGVRNRTQAAILAARLLARR